MTQMEPKPNIRIEVPFEGVARVRELYEKGWILQAFQAALEYGPLERWTGGGRPMAGRVAANVGGYQIGRVHHYLAWRADPSDPDLVAYQGHNLLQRRGPLAALEFLARARLDTAKAHTEGRAHYLSLKAMVLGHLRDFTRAWACLAEADAIVPGNPWLETTRSHLLENQDRYREALEAARRSLELRPWYRPGVQAVVHTLQLLDRHEEALEFVREAEGHLENMHVTRQLLALQVELGQHEPALATLDRFLQLAPLIEPGEREWVRWQRVSLHCHRGDVEQALAVSAESDDAAFKELADRLREASAPRRRVRLQVPFVRQHHLTCVPATLSALSQFWKQPAAHLEIAEAICYDGTPAHSERRWAIENGWCAREFTVTWDAARQLLDRGIPFTLTTAEATSGHLQAVIGYDELREVFWFRDPYVYTTGEGRAEPLLSRYRSSGPRGMALVPLAHRELLEAVELPDSGLYDQLFAVQDALARHDRSASSQAWGAMEVAAAGHRLTLTAERALASYDGNTPRLLACLDRLLGLFPEDENLALVRLGALRELARRQERLELLERMLQKRGTDPIFWQQYAQELRLDARELKAASSWMRWALRYRPTDPSLLSGWADLLWDQREFVRACDYYRLAACVGEKRENFARSYFIASRHLRETDTGLEFLRQRERQLGAKSAQPTITLAESLQHLGQAGPAFAVLEAGLLRRPNDGELRLFAADFFGRYSRFDESRRRLEEARGQSSAVAWHRTAAAVAGYQGRKSEALEHWREVLGIEVLSPDAFQQIALLLAETEGRPAALAFLNAACERFPFSCPLHALRVTWLKEDGSEPAIEPLRLLLEVNPADAWAWRELALHLAATRKPEEALQAAQEAVRLDPHRSAGLVIRGDLLIEQGKRDEARADYRRAVSLEVDNELAITRLVESASSLAERREALGFIDGELRRQVIFGGALEAYQRAAHGLLSPPEVTTLLRDAHAARPDLWQAWSVLINQLIDVGEFAEAETLAREATSRFPRLPRLSIDLARVAHAKLDLDEEIASLEMALEMNPGYGYASRLLSAACERRGDSERAIQVMEAAVAISPLDPYNHGLLAEVLHRQGRNEEALARLRQALRLEPGYAYGWSLLRDWGQSEKLAVEMARELTSLRPGEARSWLTLAGCLLPEADPDELFGALARALELSPRCEEAFDARARALAALNRFDEALAECAPGVFEPVPARLRLRAAWVEAQRGNMALALEKATAALAEYPDHYWGWQMLSDWHLQAGRIQEAIHAAEQMANLTPLEPVPLGYLGDLKLRSGDRKGAREVFARAFALSPGYDFAGHKLFELQLEQRVVPEAERTLEVLERQGKNARTMMRRVQLAVAHGEAEAAWALFDGLCEQPEVDFWALEEGESALGEAGTGRRMTRLLAKHLDKAKPLPGVAQFWVRRSVKRRKWNLHERLARLRAADAETGKAAVMQYPGQAWGVHHCCQAEE